MARTATKTKTPPTDVTDASCPCGNAVVAVLVAGDRVVIDRDIDPAGDVVGMKTGGRWVFTVGTPTSTVYGPTRRYRRHRCPATMQSDLRRQLDARDTEGPCAGYCGARVPNRYGRDCDTLCSGCKARRAATLGLPAARSAPPR